jgi:hypothetical protein
MQASFVVVMALSGLGCQNKSCDAFVAPAGYYASGQCAPYVHAGSVAHAGYPTDSASHYGSDRYSCYDLHSSIRSTLWSMVIGHDPDGVPTVAEIEASLASGGYSASAYPSGYAPVARYEP